MKNTTIIGTACPELAEMASNTVILTPAGWQVAHGLRKAMIGEVLARPATEAEKAAMAKKAAYENAAMAKAAGRKAKRMNLKTKAKAAMANKAKAAKVAEPTDKAKAAEMAAKAETASKATMDKAGKLLAKATTRRKAVETYVDKIWAEKPETDERYEHMELAFELVGKRAPAANYLGEYSVNHWRWAAKAQAWTEKLRKAEKAERELRAFLAACKEDAKAKKDAVKLAFAKLALAAPRVRKPHTEDNSTTAQTYSYKVRVASSVLPTKMAGVLAAMNCADNDDEFMVNLELAEELLPNVKLGCTEKKCIVRTLRQSEGADFFGVEHGTLEENLFLVEHDLYGRVFGPYAAAMAKKNVFIAERLNRLHERLVDILVNKGVTLKLTDGRKLEFVDVTANSSNAKKGSIMMAEKAAWSKAVVFAAAGQDLTKAQKISGQEVYKGFAVDWTPSAPINLGTKDEPQYIRIEDVIMVPELTTKVKLEKPILVGKEGDEMIVIMPKRRGTEEVKIRVKIINECTVEMTAFDGMALIWEDLPIQQIRGCGLKGLMGSVCAGKQIVDGFSNLIDWVAAKYPELGAAMKDGKLTVIDIDGVEQTFGPGKVLATTSLWKKKSFFSGEEKPWAKCQSNYARLRSVPTPNGKLWATCGVLRSASEEEAEWSYDRQTSRQALQQCWGIEDDDIRRLVCRTVGNAKAWKQFDTAFLRFAGAGTAEDELTAKEKMFRLVPQLAAERHVAGIAMNNFHRKMGDAGYMALETEAINAFMAADPVAFVKGLMTYALTGKTDVTGVTGLLTKDEVSVADLAEGQEVLTARYPMNAISMKLTKNRVVAVFAWFGRAAFVPFAAGFEQQHDGDFDGDHLYLFVAKLMIGIWKKSQKLLDQFGLNGPVVFDHAEKEDRQPWSDAFIAGGKISAIVNGQAFNLVGRFSKQASRFAALATDAIYHALKAHGKEKTRLESIARMYGYIQVLFSVGAILCIDWAKKGVPESGESREVYNTCLKLLDWAPEFGHGVMPWQQAFADNDLATPYYELTNGEEKRRKDGSTFMVFKYAAPNMSVDDRVAREVLDQGGVAYNKLGEINISTVSYDTMGVKFDPAMLGWTKTYAIGKVAVNSDVFKYVDAAGLYMEGDRKLMAKIQAGELVDFCEFVEMLYRTSINMERKLAGRVDEAEDAKGAAEIRRRAKAACRALVLTAKMEAVNTTGLSDYQLKINNLLDLLLEISRKNNIGKNEAPHAEMSRKAGFTSWGFETFGEDFLASAQKAHGMEVTANTKVVNLKKYGEYAESFTQFACDYDVPPMTDDDLLAMMAECSYAE